MRILETGTLAGATGGALVDAICSEPIAISSDDLRLDNAMLWASIEGDTGRTGGSVTVFWKGHYERAGTSYATLANPEILKSGTSTGGGMSNGTYLRTFTPGMPFIQVGATVSKAGSTMQGSSTTNTTQIKWALGIS